MTEPLAPFLQEGPGVFTPGPDGASRGWVDAAPAEPTWTPFAQRNQDRNTEMEASMLGLTETLPRPQALDKSGRGA